MKQSDYDQLILDLIEAFPDLDVQKEVDRARLWIKLEGKKISNPGTFLFKWLTNREKEVEKTPPPAGDVDVETSTRKKIGGRWHRYVTPGGWWQPELTEVERKALAKDHFQPSEKEKADALIVAQRLLSDLTPLGGGVAGEAASKQQEASKEPA